MKRIHTTLRKKDDLYVAGELLRIEVHHTSFSVFRQHRLALQTEEALDVIEDVYPIHWLPQFFAVNAKDKEGRYCLRPHLTRMRNEYSERSRVVEPLPDAAFEGVTTGRDSVEDKTGPAHEEGDDGVGAGV